ncbi:3-dehydroquinate synthase [Hydrogenobacter thermophilus TK-6]|uniref:3-dehydroquinate synthase homolog n=1 Tax=Hydrogenobacter thermophilus (strain DSM 6534 / IAM 12695 / TK-6) TaxID=608538 RepID=D3DIK1_HYDTT|nr:3-dehydroquinate synthase II [Hydrogenobacter thermophilus]ADO45579.1 3-dehydroquinate synthase [Hydrogenobacter thermophilus TK-6]BAI69653.1 3-dehydroquinate synthase [Hydrogenobacter thermophilus TK-6]
MKEFWYWAENYDKKLITTAIESGATTILLQDPSKKEEVKRLGRVSIVSQNGDLKLGEDVVYVLIKGKEDEERAAKYPPKVKVIVETTDWTIIPLENLIAQREELYAVVKNEEEAKTALRILEKGVKGIVLKSQDVNTIKRVGRVLEEGEEELHLSVVKITRILPLGLGDRVCVDTISLLDRGEGMLVGNSSGGMFLVHAETEENPYVASRPFRVNAGAVHMYIRVPGNKTKYLCELSSSDAVMVYDYKGRGRVVYVGRAKVERRPMILVEGKVENKKVSAVLQNAETIRLTRPDGTPVSVVELKEGDEVLGYIEEAGRHFGMKVEETITEK